MDEHKKNSYCRPNNKDIQISQLLVRMFLGYDKFSENINPALISIVLNQDSGFVMAVDVSISIP